MIIVKPSKLPQVVKLI